MLVKGLNGKEYKLNLVSKPKNNASTYHTQAIKLIKDTYPTLLIIEELYLKDIGLYLDIFIPVLKLGIEVDGEQHFKYSRFHHGDKYNFLIQKQRDRIKDDWFKLNNMVLIRLKYNEQNLWKDQILNAFSN